MKAKKLVIEVPKFAGAKSEYKQWKFVVQRAITRIAKRDQPGFILSRLRGKAITWYMATFPNPEDETVKKIFERMDDRFLPDAARVRANHKLLTIVQGSRSAEEYYEEFLELLAYADDLSNGMKVANFVRGLSTRIRQEVRPSMTVKNCPLLREWRFGWTKPSNETRLAMLAARVFATIAKNQVIAGVSAVRDWHKRNIQLQVNGSRSLQQQLSLVSSARSKDTMQASVPRTSLYPRHLSTR